MKVPQRKYTKANDPGFVRQLGGRPADPNPYIFHSVGLTQKQWEFVALWFPTGNPSNCIRSLIDRALKFWPAGPARFR